MKNAQLSTVSCSLPLAVLLGAAAACGGGGAAERPPYVPEPGDQGDGDDPSGPVHQSGGNSVTAVIGSAGGSLTLSGGAKLEVPAGALAEATRITFSTGTPSQAFNNRDYEQPIGPTLQAQPELIAADGQRFVVSAPMPPLPSGFSESGVTLANETMTDEQRSLGGRGRTTQTVWAYERATVSGGRMSASLSTLGGFRLQFLASTEEEFAR